MRLAICLAMATILALASGCEEPKPYMRVERVAAPESARLVDLVVGQKDEPVVIGQTPSKLWRWEERWRPVRALERHGAASTRRDSLVWSRDAWWWLEAEPNSEPTLRRSRDGRDWPTFELPATARTPGPLGDARSVPDAPLRLTASGSELLLLGPRRIWRLDQSGEPIWHRVSLDGIGRFEERAAFPAFIRNYLPRDASRDYDLLTVFSRQLHVYRRSAASDDWVMVSTLSTADRDLLAAPDGSALFLVADEGLWRSSDQGEAWYRFWPGDADPLSALAIVADSEGQIGYALLAGTDNGAILRSSDQGSEWSVVREGGPNGRRVAALGVAADGMTAFAALDGTGLLMSEDGGREWRRAHRGPGGPRPLAVEVQSSGTIIAIDRGGTWRRASGLAASWESLNRQPASAVLATPSGVTVTGTLDGVLVTQTGAENATEIGSLFRDGKGPLVIPPSGVVTSKSRAVALLRQRPGTDTLQAWSRERGVAMSTDGGRGWQPLPLESGLVDALGNGVVTDVELDADEGVYLAAKRDETHMLWYSPDDGRTWRMEREFGEPFAMVVLGPEDASALFVAHAGKVERSLDRGQTWTGLDGPWDGLRIAGFTASGSRLLVLIDSRPGYEAVLVNEPTSPNPSTLRVLLNWPSGTNVVPQEVELERGRVVFRGERAIWQADLPGAESPVPQAVTLSAIALSILTASAAVFLILRRV